MADKEKKEKEPAKKHHLEETAVDSSNVYKIEQGIVSGSMVWKSTKEITKDEADKEKPKQK